MRPMCTVCGGFKLKTSINNTQNLWQNKPVSFNKNKQKKNPKPNRHGRKIKRKAVLASTYRCKCRTHYRLQFNKNTHTHTPTQHTNGLVTEGGAGMAVGVGEGVKSDGGKAGRKEERKAGWWGKGVVVVIGVG